MHTTERTMPYRTENWKVDESFKERASARRALWEGGSVELSDASDLDRQFWAQATSTQKFDAIWSLALEAWAMKRGDEPAPRLLGSPVGIRSRAG
jgi:hypothetical protein